MHTLFLDILSLIQSKGEAREGWWKVICSEWGGQLSIQGMPFSPFMACKCEMAADPVEGFIHTMTGVIFHSEGV